MICLDLAQSCVWLVKGLWLCLWELWHSVINTTQLITECHNSHKHSQSSKLRGITYQFMIVHPYLKLYCVLPSLFKAALVCTLNFNDSVEILCCHQNRVRRICQILKKIITIITRTPCTTASHCALSCTHTAIIKQFLEFASREQSWVLKAYLPKEKITLPTLILAI